VSPFLRTPCSTPGPPFRPVATCLLPRRPTKPSPLIRLPRGTLVLSLLQDKLTGFFLTSTACRSCLPIGPRVPMRRRPPDLLPTERPVYFKNDMELVPRVHIDSCVHLFFWIQKSMLLSDLRCRPVSRFVQELGILALLFFPVDAWLQLSCIWSRFFFLAVVQYACRGHLARSPPSREAPLVEDNSACISPGPSHIILRIRCYSPRLTS